MAGSSARASFSIGAQLTQMLQFPEEISDGDRERLIGVCKEYVRKALFWCEVSVRLRSHSLSSPDSMKLSGRCGLARPFGPLLKQPGGPVRRGRPVCCFSAVIVRDWDSALARSRIAWLTGGSRRLIRIASII